MKFKNNLKKLLNYNFLDYTNKTVSCGIKDLPAIYCNTNIYPDYLALYSQTNLYHHTDRTCVCFYQYDKDFDGQNGLYESIFHGNSKRLRYFKNRFKDVKFVIAPDYSQFGDIHVIVNEFNLFRSRLVAIWFAMETSAIVIPNISFPTERSAAFALDGFEECSVVAISTKSHIKNAENFNQLSWKVRYTVDRLNLKAIIVYDICGSDEKTMECFSYAIDKGVEIVIPDNSLKSRNMINRKGELKYGKRA